MKPSFVTAAFLSIVLIVNASASPTNSVKLPDNTAYSVVERGANHCLWEKVSYVLGPDGEPLPIKHRYTELASGLNYQDVNGQWQESKEVIEPYSSGAIARYGQYQVIFAHNLNSYGAIDMQTPDGKRLRSNILGLMYHDTLDDKAVLIGQVRDSQGELISSNQVLYANAFDGVKADVRYTYNKGNFHQDVILREQLPSPSVYGLNPETTEVEVMTEFVDEPQVTTAASLSQSDEEIGWGSVWLGRGKAFDMGNATDNRLATPVRKNYVNIQGRHILLEKVKLAAMSSVMSKLPLQSSIPIKSGILLANTLNLPKLPPVRQAKSAIRLAQNEIPEKGYVIDYVAVTSGETNYTFAGDTTYYISGQVNLYGTTTVEGGAVLKYTNTATATLSLSGPLNFQTGAYRPAFFTAKDDNMVGEKISGSTGNPTINYYGKGFVYDYSQIGVLANIHDVRFRYLNSGITFSYGYGHIIRDAQFFKCGYAVAAYQGFYRLMNVLIAGGQYVDDSYNSYGYSAENVTFDSVTNFGSYTGYFTNSLVVGMDTNHLSMTECKSYFSTTANGFFQSVGAGNYYLVDNSPYRNDGTTNIDTSLLADLHKKTTYPPIVYSNVITSINTTLAPQAERDIDAPDLGYHYAPLDYLMDYYQITNAALTVLNGVAIGGYLDIPDIWLQQGSSMIAIGTPTLPIEFTFYNTVQEEPVFLSSLAQTNFSYACLINPYHAGDTLTTAATGVFKFTKFTGLADSGVAFYHTKPNWDFRSLLVVNSEIRTMYGYNTISVDSNTATAFVNNLFDRIRMSNSGNTGATFVFSNNLFWASPSVSFHSSGGIISIFNNAFDTSAVGANQFLYGGFISNDYNAYLNCGGVIPFTNSGPHYLIISNSLAYQSGPLGEFYQPTNSLLINAGSTTADLVGLYHFTTQTNQEKEASSLVDIGYHYVALDGNGNPIDSDGDGIPDYLEDSNGNGILDFGETPFGITIENPEDGIFIY